MVTNREQAEYWTSSAGLQWINYETELDTAMSGMLDMLLDVAALTSTDTVLDVGCGTGASTLAAAEKTSAGACLGIDLSQPLIDRACSRARTSPQDNAVFLVGDAQCFPFPVGCFSVLISRMGMAFFEDPVSAFRNLSIAMQARGRMIFLCWSRPERNPWFAIPKSIAETRLNQTAPSDPYAPGPTAFQDLGRITALLRIAGLEQAHGQAAPFVLAPPGTARDAARIAMRVGPAARLLHARPSRPAEMQEIETAITRAFEPFERDGQVLIPAEINLFTCTT